MQIKLDTMKNLKTVRANGTRDHWRSVNKEKTLRIKARRQAKRSARRLFA